MLRTLAFPLLLLFAAPALGGGLFVAGRDSRSVVEYDSATGALTRVFAETSDDGFQNPGGIALRPNDGVLYATSRFSGEIWSYDTPTGDVLSPAVASGLFRPGGCDFDAAGSFLYFSDSDTVDSLTSDAVRRLEIATGTVTQVGTTQNAEFDGIAVSGGFVFASDSDGDRIVRFPVAGGPGSTVINSGLSEPRGLVFASATRLLVADAGTDRVLEYEDVGGSWVFDRVVLAASAGVGEPCGLAIAPDTSLSVTGCASDDVVQVDLGTLAVSPLVAPGSAGLASPKDASWSGNTLLVATAVANAVIYFDAAGAPTGVRARGVSTDLDAGFGFAADGSTLAMASSSDGDVVEYDADTGALLRTLSSVCFLPTDVAYGPGGDLFVSCIGGNEVVRFSGATGADLGTFAQGGGMVAPRSLAFGPNGNLFVSSASGEVIEFDGTSGSYVGDFVDSSGNGGGAVDPQGFRFDGGSFYLASEFTDEVKRFDASSGAFLSTLVSGGGLDGPTGLDLGPGGDLYVAGSGDDSVRRYDAASGALVGVFVAPGSGGLDAPVDLAFRPLPGAGRGAGLAAGALCAAWLGRRRRRAK